MVSEACSQIISFYISSEPLQVKYELLNSIVWALLDILHNENTPGTK